MCVWLYRVCQQGFVCLCAFGVYWLVLELIDALDLGVFGTNVCSHVCVCVCAWIGMWCFGCRCLYGLVTNGEPQMFASIKEQAEGLVKQPLPEPFDNTEYGFATPRG